jgi:hypothetical protein
VIDTPINLGQAAQSNGELEVVGAVPTVRIRRHLPEGLAQEGGLRRGSSRGLTTRHGDRGSSRSTSAATVDGAFIKVGS